MKKTVMILLSLVALAAFVGCSNSAGSGSTTNTNSGTATGTTQDPSSGTNPTPDSSITDTSANWTSQDCWIETNTSATPTTYGELKTTDPTNGVDNKIGGDANHFWWKGKKWALSNPGFAKITSITAYENGNFDVAVGTLTVNFTLTDTPQNVRNGLFAWKDASNAYIAMPETLQHTTRQNGDKDRYVFVFDNNTKLEIYKQ
ncbi:MAG: hypothetical protein IK015_01800 [Treponema sp.]|nr:hypothetical protein [Treponema sp.]